MLIKVDAKSFMPLYEQVKSEIRKQAVLGAIKAHDPLPSIRELAADILVNPNTVARAYRELEQEGLIYTQKGRGSFLSSRGVQDSDRAVEVHLNWKMDEAVQEIKKFGLSPARIRRLFEDSLRRSEAGGRRGGGDE